MAQQPQDPWGTPEIGAAPAPAQTTPAGGTPPAPTGATADPWGKAEIGAPAPPAAPMDANGQPIHHYQVPQTADVGTASAGHLSFLDRVENMFRYNNPNYRPHSSDKDRADTSMTLIRPEEFMTETEQANHPVLTAVGQFTSGMTSPESLSIMAATMGMGEVAPVFSRLVSAGFSAQMIKGAYDQYPEFKAAMERGDASEAKRIATHIILDASMAFFAGKHALKGGPLPSSSKPTQYERANPEMMQPPAPKPPAGPNVLRPTTENIAGVEVPVTAKQAAPKVNGPSQTVLRWVADKLATKSAAREFQEERTKPAGTEAVMSALSQTAEDKIARHDALVNGRPAPESVVGTDTPGRYTDPDHIWSAMQTASEPTWEKARDASSNETKQWEQQRDSAIQAHKEAVDYFNQRASEHNASLGEGEEPIPLETFRPEDARVPPKPETFDELRDKVRDAKARAAGGPQVPLEDQTKAKEVDLPKAEKNLDKWFADHDQIVSNAEYESAKKLRAESGDFQDIANTLRTRLLQDKLNADSIRGLEGKVDGKAIRERGPAGIGTFRRLVGEDTYQNLQRVADLFDPTVKGKSGSLGEHLLEYGTGIVGLLLHHTTFGLGGVAGEIVTRKLVNEALFNPEFGRTFARVGDAVKTAYRTGTAVPSDLIGKFTDGLKTMASDIWKDEQGKAGLPGSVPHPSDIAKAQAAAPAAPAPAEAPVEAPVQTPVESQPVAPEPTPEVAPREGGNHPEHEISTREMTWKENKQLQREPNNNEHVTGWDAIEQGEKASPGYMRDLLDKILSYKDNGLKLTPEEIADPRAGLKAVINHLADNVTWLHDNMPPELRDIAKQWYDSAHTLANDIAAKHGTTTPKVAASIAALSPQNPWDMNVGQAERVVDMHQNMQNHPFTEKMGIQLSTEIQQAMKDEKPEFAQTLQSLRGKTLADLKGDSYKQALLMRILDRAHGKAETPIYAPDGKIRSYQKFNWGLIDPIAKAIDILSGDGSPQSIHEAMGDGHKIRNFYNNIVSPNSPGGHATIDTHHVNADMLKPMSSKNDVEVKDNFGGSPKNGEVGLKGTYALHHEALKQAAASRGILPREMQSIVWEGIRTLMGESKKAAMRPLVNKLWQDYQAGTLTLDEVRASIVKAAGGFQEPIWAKERANGPNTGGNEEGEGSPDEGGVSVLAPRGQTPEPVGPGTGGDAAPAVPATRTASAAEERPDLAKVKAAKVPKRRK